MRRALAAAAALVLAVPAAAGAQTSEQGEPVVGGGSFANAPLLEPGSYRDTILPGERLYYGVRLEAGQALRFRARLDVQPGEVDTDTAAGMSIGVQTPLREVITDTEEDIAGNSTVGSVDEEFNVVFSAALAPSAARGGIDYRGPGIWYPSVYLSSTLRRPAKVEFPVELELEVVGDPQPDASPEPTPAEATPTATPEGEEQDDGGTSAAAVAGVGLLGLLVGLAGGGLAARRRA